jgi:hypothetical protein
VWTDVDPDRTGILPFVWDTDFGFDRYVEYALDVPMYFLYRNGMYEDATQQRGTFREYMEGRLPIAPGVPQYICNFVSHIRSQLVVLLVVARAACLCRKLCASRAAQECLFMLCSKHSSGFLSFEGDTEIVTGCPESQYVIMI